MQSERGPLLFVFWPLLWLIFRLLVTPVIWRNDRPVVIHDRPLDSARCRDGYGRYFLKAGDRETSPRANIHV